MKLTRPCATIRDLALCARWSVKQFRNGGMPEWVRRAELKRRLYRVNYPRADQRQRGPRSVELGAWVEKWPVLTDMALPRGYRVEIKQERVTAPPPQPKPAAPPLPRKRPRRLDA